MIKIDGEKMQEPDIKYPFTKSLKTATDLNTKTPKDYNVGK